MQTLYLAHRQLALFFALFLFSGCAIQLVPDYDQALLDGLNDANTEALTLFAQVESGSTAEEYPSHARDYAVLIGKFGALRQRAQSRYVPPLASRLAEKKIIRDFCASETNPNGCLNASPASIGEILANIRRMRDLHRERGLQSGAVVAFRNRYDIQIDQALTVENALKR
ncbi:hypothetical protein [Parasphingorhabdus sp.]|uniref:hypothetical protein n=1 Tax=Parasphingorhabdus sp. TaxID=2709688 RepID=UPI0032651A5F